MTSPSANPAASVKQRQYLLLGGIVAVILGATFLGVALTTSKEDHSRTDKPRTTNILAPGAQVDPSTPGSIQEAFISGTQPGSTFK